MAHVTVKFDTIERFFGPKLRPIFKRKGLEEVFGKIRKILVGLIEDF